MKKIKKTTALILCTVMCIALAAACGGGDTGGGTGGPAPAAPVAQSPGAPVGTGGEGGGMMQEVDTESDVRFAEHIDVIVDNNNIGTINPLNPASNVSSTNWILVMVFDRLLNRNDETGEYLPALATEWHTDDFITFNFKLRDNAYFHNGDKFTAQDVANTIEMQRTLGVGSQGASQWAPISTYTIVNDYEIEFVLSEMNVDFLFNMSMMNAGVLNKRAIDADVETGSMIGTGAYKVDRFVSNDYTELSRNHEWWDDVENGGGRNIVTERITLRFVPEMSTRTIMMQNNESQLSFGTSAEDVIVFQEDPDNYQVVPLTFNNPQGFSFNFNDRITGDYNFRRAVLYALDKPEQAWFGASEWARGADDDGALWGHLTLFRNRDIPPILQDQDKAREYLAQSVYNGEVIEIAASNTTNIRQAQAMQQQLRAVGIESEVVQVDGPGVATLMATPDANSQIIYFNCVLNMSPFSIRHVLYPGASQNIRSHYNNPEVTRLLDEVISMTDLSEQEAHFKRIQEIVAEDPPFVTATWRINAVIARAGLGGLIIPGDHHQTDMRGLFLVLED